MLKINLSFGRSFSLLFFVLFLYWGIASPVLLAFEGQGGGQDCKSCHLKEWQDWAGSHHDKAMQKASRESVLGDFNNQEITVKGVTTRFFKKGEEFWVNTENRNGSMQDYRVEYTFGVTPLQQYLGKTENGKYQVLPLSWDSRPKERGGHRWFHIYGDDHVPHNDRLHWTQPLQNWNGMCADCHSTGVKRNYDPDKDQFDTTWDNINVTCISCHGPGKTHGQKMQETGLRPTISETGEKEIVDYLLSLSPDNSEGAWVLTEGERTVHWQGKKRDQSQIEVCAACHARRASLTNSFGAKEKFLDTFMPSLITTPNYFPDGQIRDEVYVWGSFVQSKMYKKGVVCSDCHNPHSLKLKADGNDLCGQCHQPQLFDTPKHHHHESGSKGVQCVNCHMTSRTFMGVDDRRDHSFRIPRPDLSVKTNSPNACTNCHSDKEPKWALVQVADWFGEERSRQIHYGEVMNDVFTRDPGAERKLKNLLTDTNVPVIIRASGYSLLVNYPNEDSFRYLKKGLLSTDPLIRLGAVRATTFVPARERRSILEPLLSDEFRAIRVDAVRALRDVNLGQTGVPFRHAYKAAEMELLEADKQFAWRGEGRVNLGIHHMMRGNSDEAVRQYLAATRIDPYFPASYVNLADLFRAQGKDAKGAEVIRKGLLKMPDDPYLNFSKALVLVRAAKTSEALVYFDRATTFAPDNSRYAYVYGVALNDFGQVEKALSVLEKAVQVSPNDGNLNSILMSIYWNRGDFAQALKFAEKLQSLFPENKQIRQQTEILRHNISVQK